MKKIGFLIPQFPAQTHIFFWREMKAVESAGYEVEIISTRKVDISLVKHAFAKIALPKTFYLHPPALQALLYPAKHPVWALQALKYVAGIESSITSKVKCSSFIFHAAALLIFAREKNIRHIHGHSCADTAHVLALAALAKTMTYSLTLHGGLSVYGSDYAKKMAHAAFVSTVTRPLQEEVHQKVGLPYDKIPVISMGVDLDKFNPEVRTLNREKPLRFITVARLSQGKGHSFSLQALERIHKKQIDFSYTIVGGGEYEKEIRAEVRDRGLDGKVRFTGTMDESQVLKELYDADVHLLTSTGDFEAAPVCVMEAMASGIPTITSIIGGTRDMVDSGVNGILVEQQNVDQIEQAMMTFIEDRASLEVMGRNARKTAEQKFDFRVQAGNLLSQIKKHSAMFSD